MAKASATNATPGGKTRVRIVVCGGKGTGKSSLIVTAATGFVSCQCAAGFAAYTAA
ncbi:hypothetical protein Patl1_22647 [Pistacia atlantica]|uniref:Uncharacterized protein n=1 Tax=Pistacia atlantica TaxID=434234 RepID=A0ACC0ZYJ6_9ROSI|nr:hypothetical protein Patl1_22647 [Pistacia atlantica]